MIIHSNVEEAAIRIMNIKPAYIPGMTLSPGSYDVEVSASGYKTERRWVELTPEENEFMIILSRWDGHLILLHYMLISVE